MNQQYLRTQYVDILQSEMPNYSVFQRNLGNQPAGTLYSQEQQPQRESRVIDKYDINLNEKYNQFSEQTRKSLNFPEKSYGPVFIAEKSGNMPNFDIEYKGTRSLFCSKFRKPTDPMKEQLQELKNQPFMKLRNSYAQNSSISLSQSDFIQSPRNSIKTSQVSSKEPNIYNRQPLRESNYTVKDRFLTIEDNKPLQYEKQNYNRNFNTIKMKTQTDERPIHESKLVFQEQNNPSNYSRYLLNNGDRRIFTSTVKSPFTSKELYTKPSEYTREFKPNDFSERFVYQQQPPNYQSSMYSHNTIDKPEVFVRQNVLY